MTAGSVVRQMDPQDFSRQVYFVTFSNASGRGVYYRLRLAGGVSGFQPDNGLLNNRGHMLQHGQSTSFRARTAERRPFPANEEWTPFEPLVVLAGPRRPGLGWAQSTSAHGDSRA